jgi:CHAT domain-containing protein
MVSSSSEARTLRRLCCAGVVALALCLGCASAVQAQTEGEGEDSSLGSVDTGDPGALPFTLEEATALLAQALPDTPDAQYAALQRQYRAAQWLEDRARLIALALQLVEAGRGRPGGEAWNTHYLSAEFTWGSSGKALQASEPMLRDDRLSLGTRASIALRQTYFAAQGFDRAILARYWSRAEALSAEAMKEGGPQAQRLALDRLQVRSEIERFQGELATSVATLREAVALGRRNVQAARVRTGNPRSAEVLDAYGWLDGSMGMLTYALVRQGRNHEAIEVAQGNLALWRAGQLGDGLGARWNYRLAASLISTQQYEAGLTAARLSDEMLQRAGASPASHTRWLARQEVVRALMGLKRWQEADAAYREFLASMPADTLARTRASDWRLLALLAAKNGRLEEALEVAEKNYRFRARLYGVNHPQTQEAAGVRAVVRLLRGDLTRAMSDFENLFAATLDNPGGWIDLDQRGVRGYVFGIAFDEFMDHVTQRALTGEALEPALSDRALQIADRASLGATQRALTDSTARVLAATPVLRALLEQEQAQRRAVAALFGQLNASFAQEDRLRREAQAPEFKALPEADRAAQALRQKTLREHIKAQQDGVAAARAALAKQREAIAQQFPAYADLVTPTSPNSAALRRLLLPGEAVLVIHPQARATLLWLIGADGKTVFHASRLTQHEVGARVTELRRGLDLNDAAPGPEPAAPLAQLHALYRELLAPLQPQLGQVRSLIVATQGALASLPFAALVTQPPNGGSDPAWLVRQMAVTQLPSPSALQALRRGAPRPAASRALQGFGDPLFKLAAAENAGQAPLPGKAPAALRYDAVLGLRYADVVPLPESRAELLAVAAALGADARADLLFGAQATRRAVLSSNLLDRRVVAFATHGLMPGELPGLAKPALAMAADADARESPLLELDDVLGLRLNAQWVLLSACNTAAGEQGGAAMSGLVRGFFFAGARSVLATHWAVESESAAALSVATFQVQARSDAARDQSLRQAQLAMADGTIGAGRWRHPFYWAPYALFGDPAR